MHDLPYAANCSLLFTEVALLERPAAAKAAGFDAIEFWWPWPDQPVPADSTVDGFVDAVRDAGVPLIGLNFFAGDLVGPDCGVLSIPARSAEFRDNIDVAVGIGAGPRRRRLQRAVRQPGRRRDAGGAGRAGAPRTSTWPPRQPPTIGATVLVEPVSGPKPYPLRTAADVIAVLDRRRGRDNVGFLCDLFHLANNGDDIDAALDARTPTGSPTCRSPTIPAAASPAAATSTSTRYLDVIEAGRLLRLRRARVQPDHHDREPRLAARDLAALR